MANLTNVLQHLRAEWRQAQLVVKNLDKAISVIQSLHGSEPTGKASQPTRIISSGSRRKMALAQKARWAKVRKGTHPVAEAAKTTSPAPVKRTNVAVCSTKDCGGSAGEVGESETAGEEGVVGRPPVTGSCFHRPWPIVLFTDAAPVDRV